MTQNELEFLTTELESIKAAIDASYDGIHILDSEGRTIFINKACERIEGITEADIGSKTIVELVEQGYYSEAITVQVLKHKTPITKIQQVKNGKKVLATGTPIYDDNGDIFRVIVNSRDITELLELEKKLNEKENLVKEYRKKLNESQIHHTTLKKLVINSPKMQNLIATILTVSNTDATILINGESGTGKSIFANLIHENSERHEEPFVKVDCGAIPETLFESELFGYEKGAFTGASSAGKAGLVELANKGTLFLDEIGEIPLLMQTRLLRLLQEKTFYKVGGNTPKTVDVRIIAATNRNLKSMVDEKKFREDLYYRINVIPIEVPPLRSRPEEIAPLAYSFVEKHNEKYGTKKNISGAVLDSFIKYKWPGNVRELENVVERMFVTSIGNLIDYDALPDSIKFNGDSPMGYGKSLKELMAEHEKNILTSLVREGHSAIQISEMLSLDVTNVRRKLHKHKIKMK